MKWIKFIFLIVMIMSLAGCEDPVEPIVTPPIPTEPVPTEPIPTEPIPTDPVITPWEMLVSDSSTLSTITSDDFSQKTLYELEIMEDQVTQKTYLAYRLISWFTDELSSVEGFIIEGTTTEYYVQHLSSIYLIVGEKNEEETILYPHEALFITRLSDDHFEKMVLSPSKLSIRQMNPETAIYYIDYSSITGRYDHHTSLRAVQGIINRDEPRLLTLSSGNPYYKKSDEAWLSILEDEGYDLIELSSLEEVIYTFKGKFQGIITFKDRFKSYNGWVAGEPDFASMMASLTDYAPVPFGTQQLISELTGLPIVDSFVVNGHTVSGNISDYLDSEGVISAYDSYALVFNKFRQAFNRSAYMSLTSEVSDYAVSEKMMFFDLKATQSERDNLLSRQINAYFDQNNLYFQVYGWVDHESSALDFISSYGGLIDVVGSGNLSLLSRLPIDQETFTQKAVDSATYNPEKKYVTFFASESDTIKVGVAFQHGAWFDPYRGMVKINWGLISDMSVEFPFAYRYFIDTATENDYFYSGGGSAIGFVDIDSQMNYLSRDAIADANKYYMEIADQQLIDMYNDKYISTDLFEKSVLGSYLNRSDVLGAFARIHDGNTSIRVESWSSIPVYNRWTNFYPRRSSSGDVAYLAMDKMSDYRYEQDLSSDYWFIQSTLANTLDAIHYDLFVQENGDRYRVTFEDGSIHLKTIINGVETVLSSKVYNTATRNIKLSIDHSTPLDQYTRIKLYVNDLKIFEYFDAENHFTEGGYAIETEGITTDVVTNLQGTRFSMAEQIFNSIVNDNNHFILAYYGFVGTEEYTLAQYRTEPGIGGVISLSPTDFYKIKLLLDLHYPGEYEIVNAREFMEFAVTYQQYYGTLR
ncbi:MAG: hypothetical protein C4537_03525 [Acholeplasma sp.]|jgi:hypothetical protein|nr:MAG: hypothetical protein C4537_03525 [Acholeplasma sp.]